MFLAWNLPNWITVVLMVALGYLVFGLVTQLVMRRGGAISMPGFGAASSTAPPANDVMPGGYPGAALVYGGGSYAGFGA